MKGTNHSIIEACSSNHNNAADVSAMIADGITFVLLTGLSTVSVNMLGALLAECKFFPPIAAFGSSLYSSFKASFTVAAVGVGSVAFANGGFGSDNCENREIIGGESTPADDNPGD